ncbi:hypothetical protein IFM89_003202 [Coptis chinensis]|uniref:Myosin motor domain-containing protein n=1 Tax=Coptis chinensis TaxID=261450 RepID=A0A835LL30_9MAGN|nr:hypothetical protein IFM89_003202 [Coptis chinensis]
MAFSRSAAVFLLVVCIFYKLQMTYDIVEATGHVKEMEYSMVKKLATIQKDLAGILIHGGVEKPRGIIALLDEACMFPKSTHETFAQKLYQTFKNNKRFIKPKLSRTDFTISHYVGEVTYQADQFLDKNKDYVVAEHQELMTTSKCSFVAGLIPPTPDESSKSSKFSSIGDVLSTWSAVHILSPALILSIGRGWNKFMKSTRKAWYDDAMLSISLSVLGYDYINLENEAAKQAIQLLHNVYQFEVRDYNFKELQEAKKENKELQKIRNNAEKEINELREANRQFFEMNQYLHNDIMEFGQENRELRTTIPKGQDKDAEMAKSEEHETIYISDSEENDGVLENNKEHLTIYISDSE